MTENITRTVQSKYASVAKSGLSTGHAGVKAVAEAFGYTPEQLASIPAEANMGLSCGNPTAFASLKPGETVVDLGCGGGLDVFLAAARVGPNGKAISDNGVTPSVVQPAGQQTASLGDDDDDEQAVPEQFGGKDDLQLQKAIEILKQGSAPAKAA